MTAIDIIGHIGADGLDDASPSRQNESRIVFIGTNHRFRNERGDRDRYAKQKDIFDHDLAALTLSRFLGSVAE